MRFPELKYFSLIFFSTSLSSAGEIGAILTGLLFFHQLQYITLQLAYLQMFALSMRITFKKTPKIIKYSVALLSSLLSIIVLTWSKMEQPENAKTLFWVVHHSHNGAYPHGAGLRINDNIIYSTSFFLLLNFYMILCVMFFLFAILSIRPAISTPKIRKSYTLWIITAILNIVWAISTLPWFPRWEILNILVLVQYIIVYYIVLRIPEGMLISQHQLFRVYGLMVDIKEKQDKSKNFKMDSLLDYINLALKNQEEFM